MKEADVEQEVQARVRFKLEQLMTVLKNRTATEWFNTLGNNSLKHVHYWEAFEEVQKMMQKEISMPTPYDCMADHYRKEMRDKAVEKLASSLLERGDRNYSRKISTIVNAIEEAQNF